MKIFTLLRRRSGSSTLQVLALTTLIGAGYYGSSSHQQQVVTELINERAQRYYVELYHSLIESILRNPTACGATFFGTSPSGAVTQIRSAPGVVAYSTGAQLGADRTNVVRIRVDLMEWATGADANGGELVIAYSAEVGEKVKNYSRSIRINYTLAGTIQSCSSSDFSSLEQACESLNGSLVGGKCVSPRVAGTFTKSGSISSSATTVSNVASTATYVASGIVTSNSIISNGTANLGSLSGNSIASSSSLSSTTTNIISFPICASGGCQTWMMRSCAANQYMYAILSNGDISCATW